MASGPGPNPNDASVDLPKIPDDSITGDLDRVTDPTARLIVELSTDGRLRAPSRRTREILRKRLRRAEVLPTGRGWAVVRDLDESPEAEESVQPRVVVAAGTISETGVSLIDFIGFLASGYQTGVLTVAHTDIERSIYFNHGDVVWASSSAPDDRLGEFLLRRGKITREQLQTVLIRDGDKKIGRACVERGYIAAYDLWSMVQAQLKEIIDKLLAMEHGVWLFSRVSSESLAESQITLSTQGVLMDALRRIDELKVFREKIRSPEIVVQRLRRPDPPGDSTADLVRRLDEEIREDARVLLAHLPASATILELMRILGKGEFEVTRAVYHLLKASLVEIVQAQDGPAIPRRAAVTRTEASEVITIYSMAVREMFEEMARSGQSELLLSAATEFLKGQEGQYAGVFHSLVIHADGSLDEESLIAAVQETGLTAQGLSDALSELLFFVLFQATEFLGRRRGDDLARRVKMIHEMLSHHARQAET